MSALIVTEHHLELARKKANAHARAEIALDLPPADHTETWQDRHDLIFEVTGLKVDPDTDESAPEIISAFDDEYWDTRNYGRTT